METLEQLSAGYRDRAQRAAQALGRLQRLIYRIGTLRLLLFVAGVAGLIVLRAESWAVHTTTGSLPGKTTWRRKRR